jgi:hypothetical protein
MMWYVIARARPEGSAFEPQYLTTVATGVQPAAGFIFDVMPHPFGLAP